MDGKIDKAIQRVLKLYNNIENELLQTIASHFKIDEEFENADYWRIQKLQEMGLFNKETIKIIAKYSGKTEKEVKAALEEIGVQTKNLPTLKRAYKNGYIKFDPKRIENNNVLQEIVDRAVYNTDTALLELNKRIVESTKRTYLNILEQAYLKTTTGTHSYTGAINEALNKLGDEGITTLNYQVIDETGEVVGFRKYSIEAAVRRDVLTEARNLNHKMTDEIVADLEPEYLYLSEHLNCRETHYPWQGTVIKAEDLEEITGYGEVDGLGGINCRHYYEPYWGDARGNELKQYSQDECEKAYFYEQHQRYLERGIRSWKRKELAYEAAHSYEEAEKAHEKTLEWTRRNQTFIDLINEDKRILKRDFTRESIYEKPYTDSTDELKKLIEGNQIDPTIKPSKEPRRLKYSMDKNKKVYKDYYFDPDKDIKEEIEYQKKIEQATGYKTYLNPKPHEDGIKTPDYYIENINEMWDIKDINGSGKRTIDNILKKAERQTYNLILKQKETTFTDEELKEKLITMFKYRRRTGIKKVVLIDDKDNIIIYLQR